MKATNLLTAACLLVLATACTDSTSPDTDPAPGMPATITATLSEASDTPTGTNPQTRLHYESEGTAIDYPGVKVTWTVGDAFRLFRSEPGFYTADIFEIKNQSDITNNGKTATFTKTTGNNKEGGTIFNAVYPASGALKFDLSEVTDAWNEAMVNMDGQIQTGNDSYDHLAAYDFMYAEPSSDHYQQGTIANLDFGHRMAMMTVKITGRPADYTPAADGSNAPTQLYMTVEDNKPNFYRSMMFYNFSGYATGEEGVTRNSANLGLENITWGENGFTAHLMILPINLTGTTFTILIRCKDGTTYQYTTPQVGKKYVKAMRYTAKIAGSDWKKVTDAPQRYTNDTQAATTFAGGDGTSKTPYLISNPGELMYLQNLINNSSEDSKKYMETYFRLTTDIEIADDVTWIPIGNNSHNFYGYFDGNGHTISGTLRGNNPDFGFFGIISSNQSYLGGGNIQTTVRNLHIKAEVENTYAYNYSTTCTGALAGQSDQCTVSGCSYTGSLTGAKGGAGDVAGGLIGTSKISYLVNCSVGPGSTVKVTAGNTSSTPYSVGGLVGVLNAGTIMSCTNYASVTGSVSKYANNTGGLVGTMKQYKEKNTKDPAISLCKNYGTVKGGTSSYNSDGKICDTYTGGLVGDMQAGKLHSSHNMTGADVTKGSSNKGTVATGGLAGHFAADASNTGIIYDCCTNQAQVGGAAAADNNRIGNGGGTITACDEGHTATAN